MSIKLTPAQVADGIIIGIMVSIAISDLPHKEELIKIVGKLEEPIKHLAEHWWICASRCKFRRAKRI